MISLEQYLKKNNKDSLRIIVTDSGLGGLSVQAYLDSELKKHNVKVNVDLIYFNALYSHDYGYNTMTSKEEKVNVFNSALTGMLKLNPDIILIACNTLSVIYYETKFSKNITIPILGIVESGVNLVIEEFEKGNDSNIILFGTETTISSEQHKNDLIQSGVESNKIIEQSCNNLESEIQLDPNNKEVLNLIDKYSIEAINKNISACNNYFAVLCCTHYSYSYNHFQEILSSKIDGNIIVLNPNKKMADVVVNEVIKLEGNNSTITNSVLSRVDIYKKEKENLGKLLMKDSPSITEALNNYVWDESLFSLD